MRAAALFFGVRARALVCSDDRTNPNDEHRLDHLPERGSARRADRPGRRRAGRRPRSAALSVRARRRDRRAAAGCGARHQGDGHHLHGLSRAGWLHRSCLAARHHSAHDLAARMAQDRDRAQAARRRAQPFHRRRVSPPAHRARRRVPGGDHCLLAQLPPDVRRHRSAAGLLGARLRHRPGAGQGRHGLRAGRQSARALGRVVHDREPPGHQARVPRAVRKRRDPAGGRLSIPALRHAGRARDPARRKTRNRRADAGDLQLRLLRARLPGAADGLRAGRRARSRGRRRRLRLHADGARLEARGRYLSAHRRRLSGRGGFSQGLRRSACRA